MSTALIIVDVQNDFCEGGSLAVTGGAAVAAGITRFLNSANYPLVVATRDYHIDPGEHFSDEPNYVDTWPRHCRCGTTGADFHPALNTRPVAAVFDKGAYSAAYSGFEGVTEATGTGLAHWLRVHDVEAVDIVGIATDHCVKATALDAVANGFATRVLVPLTAGVAAETTARALAAMRTAGVEIVDAV